jgi:chaperone required for assembly of F1-ATPase
MTDHRDPIDAARLVSRPELPKRFYTSVAVGAGDGGFSVLLDGRPARTPNKSALVVPSRVLAERLAAEWAAQRETIDPATMPMTRLVNAAIEGVATQAEAVRAEIVKYAASDLLCYRAGEPEGLVVRQATAWDPVLVWAHDDLGARFVLSEGVMFVEQPPLTLAAIGRAIAALDVLTLAATQAMTTLTGSALLALAVMRGRLSAEEAWAAAHVDEDWNVAQWGADEEAAARRARRWTEMQAAAALVRLSDT